MTETSVGGGRYYVCFKDDYSKYCSVFFITTKSEVADCLQWFLKEVKKAGQVTKVLLSDGGKKFNCEAVQKVFEEYGITHRLTMPYTHEQNGAAEQENSTIVESARSILHASRLPEKNCGLRPVIILRYTYSPILGLYQWKVRCLWNCGLDPVQLFDTCVFWGHNVMCTFPNRRGTNGPKE
jgi:Integrase core domain.